MGSSEKRSKDVVMSDIPTFSAENFQKNLKVIQNSRTFLSIIAGVLAGIIGFTGLTGFLFYFVVMLITSLGLMAKAGFSADVYFDSWNRVLFDGFLGGLMVRYIFLFLATPPLSSCM
uniref:ER membrane protein complex subunit 6 n=1 Tax=Brassica campestris TaxID=3711 RepID=M4D0N1_BRACM